VSAPAKTTGLPAYLHAWDLSLLRSRAATGMDPFEDAVCTFDASVGLLYTLAETALLAAEAWPHEVPVPVGLAHALDKLGMEWAVLRVRMMEERPACPAVGVEILSAVLTRGVFDAAEGISSTEAEELRAFIRAAGGEA
jgi:hypothetical protein